MEETLPRMPEWKRAAEDQEARPKMIRLMSDDPGAKKAAQVRNRHRVASGPPSKQIQFLSVRGVFDYAGWRRHLR